MSPVNQSVLDFWGNLDLISLASFLSVQIMPLLDYVIAGGLATPALMLIFNSIGPLSNFLGIEKKKSNKQR